MICVYTETCVNGGRRAWHDDENESKRACGNGDHMRVGQTLREARSFDKRAGAFFRKVARTIRDNALDG